ncbi:MAG: AraC family transcriptional regulator [Gammaproteobacteria bacterium]|nr:AraC family transcriptional regulator [Gammaproteobacteria bacterium]
MIPDPATIVATLLIGYSLFSALVIALTHLRAANYSGQGMSRAMGLLLLLILSCLQLLHLGYLQQLGDFIHGPVYRLLLFAVAPAFYLFSHPLLRAQPAWRGRDFLHALPVVAAPFLPYAWALPLAFLIGAGYLVWLARSVHALRAQRSRFRMELAVLGGVFVIALLVVVLAFALPLIGEDMFYSLYASAIGGAFVLVGLALGLTPRLSVEVVDAARETYAVSTLAHVDCAAALARLEALMTGDRLYEDAELDLAGLARRVGLSAHQLSELINTRRGISFSRFLRQYRVEAAQRMLIAEPSASVLSVGLSVGFTSQSNFYDAFREITGMTPGRFRRIGRASAPE